MIDRKTYISRHNWSSSAIVTRDKNDSDIAVVCEITCPTGRVESPSVKIFCTFIINKPGLGISRIKRSNSKFGWGLSRNWDTKVHLGYFVKMILQCQI